MQNIGIWRVSEVCALFCESLRTVRLLIKIKEGGSVKENFDAATAIKWPGNFYSSYQDRYIWSPDILVELSWLIDLTWQFKPGYTGQMGFEPLLGRQALSTAVDWLATLAECWANAVRVFLFEMLMTGGWQCFAGWAVFFKWWAHIFKAAPTLAQRRLNAVCWSTALTNMWVHWDPRDM